LHTAQTNDRVSISRFRTRYGLQRTMMIKREAEPAREVHRWEDA
jgi:hypothetical protein